MLEATEKQEPEKRGKAQPWMCEEGKRFTTVLLRRPWGWKEPGMGFSV